MIVQLQPVDTLTVDSKYLLSGDHTGNSSRGLRSLGTILVGARVVQQLSAERRSIEYAQYRTVISACVLGFNYATTTYHFWHRMAKRSFKVRTSSAVER